MRIAPLSYMLRTAYAILLAALATNALAQSATGAGAAVPQPAGATIVVQTNLDKQVLDIAANLRCLVCQNQSIADSHAPLAIDLRAQIREQLQAGKNQTQINSYMADRYGSFVLYSPPVQSQTWLLWFGPFALLLGLSVYAWRLVHRRAADSPVASAKATQPPQTLLDDILK